MEKPFKPAALVFNEAKLITINAINQILQETGISLTEYALIIQEIYNEINEKAAQELQRLSEIYQAQLKQFEDFQNKPKNIEEVE